MRTIAAAIAGLCTPLAPNGLRHGKTLAALDSHQCRFPLHGEGATTRFCAVEIAPGDWMPGFCMGSYCQFHRGIARGRGTESERTAPRVLANGARQ